MKTEYELVNPRLVSELSRNHEGQVYWISPDWPTPLTATGYVGSCSDIRDAILNPTQLWGTGYKVKEPVTMQAPILANHSPHWVDDRPPTVEEVGDGDWAMCITNIRPVDANKGYYIRSAWSEGHGYPWLCNIPPYVGQDRYEIVHQPDDKINGPYLVKKKAKLSSVAFHVQSESDALAIKAIYERGAK